MKYIIDHDLHIHSKLSLCSLNEAQTPEKILEYGIKNGFKQLCLTDHFWDERVPHPGCAEKGYEIQNSEYIMQSLPLPQADGIEFLFGAECEMDKNDVVGISDEFLPKLDFLIVPLTHLHIRNFTFDGSLTEIVRWKIPDTEENFRIMSGLWIKRFKALLNASLPFHKTGVAHLQWFNYSEEISVAKTLDLIPDATLGELFTKAAKLGAGIELNFNNLKMSEEIKPSVFRLFETAKECGCKFYFGSDAHTPADLEHAKENFTSIAERLNLKEDDKFIIS